jgi:hypothetical protein
MNNFLIFITVAFIYFADELINRKFNNMMIYFAIASIIFVTPYVIPMLFIKNTKNISKLPKNEQIKLCHEFWFKDYEFLFNNSFSLYILPYYAFALFIIYLKVDKNSPDCKLL